MANEFMDKAAQLVSKGKEFTVETAAKLGTKSKDLGSKALTGYKKKIRDKAIEKVLNKLQAQGLTVTDIPEKDLEIMVREAEDEIKNLISKAGMMALILLGISN